MTPTAPLPAPPATRPPRSSARACGVGAAAFGLGLSVLAGSPVSPASAQVTAVAAAPVRVRRVAAAVHPAPVPAGPARAAAARPGVWSVVSANVGSSTPTAQVVRFGGGELVVFGVQNANSQSIASRRLTFTGAAAGPLTTVVGAWSSAALAPALISVGGRPTVVFNGYRDAHGSTPYDRATLKAAQLVRGNTWTLAPGALSRDDAAPGVFGMAATTVAGRTLTAFTTDSGRTIGWHQGIDPFTAGTPDHRTPPLPACCATRPSVAQDTVTKQVWTAFHDDGATPTANGVFAARLLPTAGRPAKQPASSVGVNSLDPGQRVPLVARAGGGLWTAYRVGYPTSTHIRLRNVENGRSLTVATGTDVKEVGLAAAPGGRVWVYWDGDDALVRAVRTNAAVTAVGAVRTVVLPGRTGDVAAYGLDGEGSTGPLTVAVTTSDDRTGADRLLATRIAPALRLVPGRTRLRPGQRFGLVVTDAGTGIGGVRVRLGARTAVTNARGVAFLTVPASGPRRVVLTASRAGYASATAAVTVG